VIKGKTPRLKKDRTKLRPAINKGHLIMTRHAIGTPEQLRDPNYICRRCIAPFPWVFQALCWRLFVIKCTPAIIIAGARALAFGSKTRLTFPNCCKLIQMSIGCLRCSRHAVANR